MSGERGHKVPVGWRGPLDWKREPAAGRVPMTAAEIGLAERTWAALGFEGGEPPPGLVPYRAALDEARAEVEDG